MSGLLILLALGLLIFYSWGAAAFWQAASRQRVKLARIVALWNALAALGSLFFLLDSLSGRLSLLGMAGAGFAIATPFLWELGQVRPRLRRYGLSLSRIYSFHR